MSAPQKDLVRGEGGKIVLLVIDGLGGLPDPRRGQSELQAACLPHLDRLAASSSTGRVQILARHLTPGSGPGHLSLFGYDPHGIDFGRGLLEALGSDYPLAAGEIAARGNFCTLDADGRVSDRRAGRPSDQECQRLCSLLTSDVTLTGAEVVLLPGKQHRFTLVLRGAGLGPHVNDNDPQVEGKPPHAFVGRDADSQRTAALATEFCSQASRVLAAEAQASGTLLRGFSAMPPVEGFRDRYRLRAAAIAVYPMYRGVARLVGMDVLSPGVDLAEQTAVARQHWDQYDFFFIHTKDPDTAGHSGDFDAKVAALEAVDAHLPGIEALGADVLMITGDHSTPTVHREHSWHPVPLLIHSSLCLPCPETTFDEVGVLRGDLGTLPGEELMNLALAHAGRLDKFGA